MYHLLRQHGASARSHIGNRLAHCFGRAEALQIGCFERVADRQIAPRCWSNEAIKLGEPVGAKKATGYVTGRT